MRWAAVLTLLATVIASWRLSDAGIWLDESLSILSAHRDIRLVMRDNNMTLYFLALKGWLNALDAGHNVAAVRSLSVLTGVATVPVFFDLSRRLFGSGVARVSTLLIVLNGFFIQYTREARGYALATLLTVTATWSLVRLVQDGKARWAASYGLLSALAVYAHLFAALVPLAHLAWLIPRWREHHFPRGWIVKSHLVAAALVTPAFVLALGAGPGPVRWLHPTTFPILSRTWTLLSGCSPWLGAGTLLALMALVADLLRTDAASERRWRLHLVLSWALVPVGITLLVSWLLVPLVHPRFLIIVVPALCLALGVALETWLTAKWRVVALAGLIVVSSLALRRELLRGPREPWRELVAWIARDSRPGDGVVLDLLQPMPLVYSVEELGAQVPFPPIAERASIEDFSRLWLVRNRSHDAELQRGLEARYVRAFSMRFSAPDNDGLFESAENRALTLERYEQPADGSSRDRR